MHLLDPHSRASLPGQLRLSRAKYARYFSGGPLGRCFRYLGTFIPYWVASVSDGPGSAVRHWLGARAHLRSGCLCPSVVVNPSESLIASFTSLTGNGDLPTPVVKIHQVRLDLLPAALRARESRLVSVSVYYRTEESWERGQWSDFDPLPAAALAEDSSALAASESRLVPAEWQALAAGIAQLGPNPTPGIHPITLSEELEHAVFGGDSSAPSGEAGAAEPDAVDCEPTLRAILLRLILATIVDIVSGALVSPLIYTLIFAGLCWYRVLPLPAAVPFYVAGGLGLLLLARMVRNFFFIRNSFTTTATVGPQTRRVLKWDEHVVTFSDHRGDQEARCLFARKSIGEGDEVLIAAHRNARRGILLLRRQADDSS